MKSWFGLIVYFDFQPRDEFGVKLNFQLLPQMNAEAQLPIEVTDVTFPQKLRGTLTYMVESSVGAVQEKLDFAMQLPCSSFMIGQLSHKDILTELLKSGQLTTKVKKEVSQRKNFSNSITSICQSCHVTLVEQINDTASLYGHSLQGHHVCLLLKQNVS